MAMAFGILVPPEENLRSLLDSLLIPWPKTPISCCPGLEVLEEVGLTFLGVSDLRPPQPK
jgi:hypothetical protein